MKILHASHTHTKDMGARNYFLPVRINNGFIRNGHDVFWFSDRDVARCSAPFNSRKLGVGAANKRFLEVCQRFRPDVIALATQDVLSTETIARARQLLPNVAVLQYFIDPLFDASNFRNVSRKIDVVDHTFVTTGGSVLSRLAGMSSRVSFMPNPVDASIDVHRCHERSDQAHDVFFGASIAKWTHPGDLRANATRLMRERLPQAKLDIHGHDGQGWLLGADFTDALANARIGLSFSQRDRKAQSGPGGELYLYSSDRIGLYLGNGLLVFSTAPFSMSEVYGDAIVEVGDGDEFIDRLRHYIDNDDARREHARRGYELGHAEFNERLVAQYLLEATLGQPWGHAYRWPTESFGREGA